jgi:hypothetical protein
LHLAQHHVGVDHVDIGIRGIGRDQIIVAANLRAMPGVIEKPHIGALRLFAKFLYDVAEFTAIEIELGAAANEREAHAAQRFGHQFGIVFRIVEPSQSVFRISDDERHAPLGMRRRGNSRAKQCDKQKKPKPQPNHFRDSLDSLARPQRK